jgi:hypothetical protein
MIYQNAKEKEKRKEKYKTPNRLLYKEVDNIGNACAFIHTNPEGRRRQPAILSFLSSVTEKRVMHLTDI